ncbi:SpoIIE family protein phosphatase [Streptomyces sp. NPDC006527]|uniref:SpoIIE family protein phosphatase n=1 Tax=Streptomyces sp. NPDC006527 TaxID=3364749 RepID=UPI0036ACF423
MNIPFKGFFACRPAVDDLPEMATFLLNDQGMIVAWSVEAGRLLGYSEVEVTGRHASELWPEAFPDACGAPAGPSAATSPLSRCMTVVSRPGCSPDVALLAAPCPLEEGTLILALPARLLAAEEDRALLDAVFTRSPISMAVYDTQLRLMRINAALARSHGISEAHVLGRRIAEVLPEVDTAAIEDRLRQVIATGLPISNVSGQVEPSAGSGSNRPENAFTIPLLSPEGRLIGVTDVITSVTDSYYRAGEGSAALRGATACIGATLDVTRTAEELADLLVPSFADVVVIDLVEGVLQGEEPQHAGTDGIPLRLAASKAHQQALVTAIQLMSDRHRFPPDTPQGRTLTDGQAKLVDVLDPQAGWIRASPDSRLHALLQCGAHSLILAPLHAMGASLGLVHLYRAGGTDPFQPHDLALARKVVTHAALSVEKARRFIGEHAALVTLHESMLPRLVPDQSAVQVSHHYRPARRSAGISGEWFDVIPLSGLRVALVVGGVPGAGFRAAASVGQICATVRTLAQLDLSPDELLARLDDMVPRLVERESIGRPFRQGAGSAAFAEALVGATCLYVVYDPISRQCVMASAGHPPPAIAEPIGPVWFPGVPTHGPLGLGEPVFEAFELELAEGSTLALYTERLLRAWHADRALAEQLRAILADGSRPLDASSRMVADAIAPHLSAEDGLALLFARTRSFDTGHVATWDVALDRSAVSDIRSLALRQLDLWGLEHLAFSTELIVSELVTNGIRYGQEPIRLRLIHDRALTCEVSDASSTSPHIRRAATTDEGGRGLFLVAQLSHRWGTRYTTTGKTIWAEQLTNPENDDLHSHRAQSRGI